MPEALNEREIEGRTQRVMELAQDSDLRAKLAVFASVANHREAAADEKAVFDNKSNGMIEDVGLMSIEYYELLTHLAENGVYPQDIASEAPVALIERWLPDFEAALSDPEQQQYYRG